MWPCWCWKWEGGDTKSLWKELTLLDTATFLVLHTAPVQWADLVPIRRTDSCRGWLCFGSRLSCDVEHHRPNLWEEERAERDPPPPSSRGSHRYLLVWVNLKKPEIAHRRSGNTWQKHVGRTPPRTLSRWTVRSAYGQEDYTAHTALYLGGRSLPLPSGCLGWPCYGHWSCLRLLKTKIYFLPEEMGTWGYKITGQLQKTIY